MQASPDHSRETERVSLLAACLFLPGMVFVFFTAVIYHNNSEFIDSPFAYILLAILPMYVAVAGILWIVGRWMNDRLKLFYSAALGSLGVLVWIIGNFLMFDHGLLDGTHPLKADSILYRRTELSALAVAFLLLLFAATRFRKVFAKALTVFNFLMIGMVLVTVATDKKSYSLQENHDSFYEVSSKKNVFVFLFDTFQSDLFEEIVAKEPDLQAKLQGFTYFPKAAGVAPTTYLSLPAIHSGLEYPMNTSLVKYYDQGIQKSSFLAKLSSAGYDGMLIGSIGSCPNGIQCFYINQITLGTWKAIWKDAFFLLDLSLYRSVPSILKQSVYRKGKWLTINLFFTYSRTVESNRFLMEMAQRFSPTSEKPVARFMHLYNTHPPAEVDSSCRVVDGVRWTRESATNQDTCAVHLFINLLDSFKQKGFYDNSVIVVLADHGAGFPRPFSPPVMASANPLLMIKPFRNRERFRISGNPVSLLDIAKTVCSLTGNCDTDKGLSLFDNPTFNGRAVVYNDYKWKHEYWYARVVPVRHQYSIIGPVDEILSWYKQTSPEQVRAVGLSFSKADASEVFDFGWGIVERNRGRSMRWAVGRYAQLYLALQQSRDATLTVVVSTHPRNKNQKMILYLDDTRIGESAVQPAVIQTLSFQIPAERIVHPVSRFTFLFDQYNRLKTQPRPLAVAFYHLDVAPTPSQKN